MKKFLKLATLMLGLVLTFSLAFTLTSCERVNSPDSKNQPVVYESFSPELEFSSMEDLVALQTHWIDAEVTKNTFLGLQPAVLKNVYSVLSSKSSGAITVKQIVEEYTLHQDVYDNLYKEGGDDPGDKQLTEGVEDEADSTQSKIPLQK